MPKISVLMPVYNEKPEYLRNAIESVLNQTCEDFELVIVDDASELYVGDIINSYSDARIKYTRFSENSKICAALNFAKSNSCGEYIAIMHSDDIAIRSRLEKESEILDEKTNVGLVNSYSVLQNKYHSKLNMPYLDSEIEKLYLRYIGNNIVHPNVMLRRSILDENNITYNSKFVFAEDYRMWTDMMPYCDFYTVPEVLTLYNIDVNPKRQNKEYMDKCKKVILLENYMRDFGLDEELYKGYIEKIWEKNKIKYINYLNIKKDIISCLEYKLQKVLTNYNYYSLINKAYRTVECFSSFAKENDDILQSIL